MSRAARVVVCVNERLGAGQRSCVGSGSLDLISRLESKIATAKLDVPLVRRECLNRCEQGPVMRIAPAGRFFTEVDEATLNDIVDQLKIFIEQQDA